MHTFLVAPASPASATGKNVGSRFQERHTVPFRVPVITRQLDTSSRKGTQDHLSLGRLVLRESNPKVRKSFSSQIACRADSNFLWPKPRQPARQRAPRNSENENARAAESRASCRVIGSRKISAAKIKRQPAGEIRVADPTLKRISGTARDIVATPYSVFIVEMMKCKRAQHDVIGFDRMPFENIASR